MSTTDGLATAFEEHRGHLRSVAYRLLGSTADADDAVQEAWLRLAGADTSGVENLGGWLTTVVARVSLNMLRSRRYRREEPVGDSWSGGHRPGGPVAGDGSVLSTDPEDEAVLADTVGLALLVVLDTLTPAERVAFVLHDLFAMPFTDVAEVIGRTAEATRQLASRARRRVRGTPSPDHAVDVGRQRDVTEAFLAAARGGDLQALVALLDPDVKLTGDAAVTPSGRPRVLQGAAAVGRGAVLASARARQSQLALVDGTVSIIYAPAGKLQVVLTLEVNAAGLISVIDIAGDRDRLRRLRVAVLPD